MSIMFALWNFSHNKAKKLKRLKIVKLKGQNQTFSAVSHHQGKQNVSFLI